MWGRKIIMNNINLVHVGCTRAREMMEEVISLEVVNMIFFFARAISLIHGAKWLAHNNRHYCACELILAGQKYFGKKIRMWVLKVVCRLAKASSNVSLSFCIKLFIMYNWVQCCYNILLVYRTMCSQSNQLWRGEPFNKSFISAMGTAAR